MFRGELEYMAADIAEALAAATAAAALSFVEPLAVAGVAADGALLVVL